MNLFELIQHIPEFIQNILQKFSNEADQIHINGQEMIGKFYLGLSYDYQ